MNKSMAFAARNTKEILRDKLTLIFGLGFPLVILLLLTLIQNNIPAEVGFNSFEPVRLVPGIAVFGHSFISLFSGSLIAKDRGSSFMLRLFTSPLTAVDYIVGYALPLLPMAILQTVICFGVSLLIGLEFSMNVLVTLLVMIPCAVIFISIGLISGCLLNEKQVGGICGAALTNVSAWLSGTWFDLGLMGEGFEKFANVLPFAHAVAAGRSALAGNYSAIFSDLWVVLVYAVGLFAAAIIVMTAKINSKNK